MKNIIKSILFILITTVISSCEKDEGKLPDIKFKTGGSYTSSDATVAGGSNVTIGITASKTEDKDVLKKFNISRSINGGSESSVFDKELSGTEGDVFNYDYTVKMDTVHNQTNKYTFTVTNRDGLVNQVSLTVQVQ